MTFRRFVLCCAALAVAVLCSEFQSRVFLAAKPWTFPSKSHLRRARIRPKCALSRAAALTPHHQQSQKEQK
jgi:hypothetical protein